MTTPRIDTLRINALVNALLAPGATFDSDTARELRDSIPDEPRRTFRASYYSSRPRGSVEGLTNLGRVSASEDSETSWDSAASRGVCAGRWRVVRNGDTVTIEPRFNDTAIDESPCYALRFRQNGRVEFRRSKPRVVRIPLWLFFRRGSLNFGLTRMVHYKSEGFPQ
jgi:hypothetical protein